MTDASSSVPPTGCPYALDDRHLRDPHAGFAGLRAGGAVHLAVAPDGAPVHLVTGYHEVRAAAADPRLALDKRHARTAGSAGDSLPPELDGHLLNRDGADHARLRRLLAEALGPRRILALGDRIRLTADRLLDPLAGCGGADLVADLAMPLAMTVICDLLGVPPARRTDFRTWTDTLLSPDPGAPGRSREAMRAMHAFLVELVAEKGDAPGDDLLSDLIAAHRERAALGGSELVAMAFLLLFAGYHNSAGLISGTLYALLTHPAQLAAARSGRLDPDRLTDEVLRWNPPAMLAVRRFTTEPVTLAGTTVPPGERVWLSWAAANRDPDVFPRPELFDPDRDGPGHLAFGRGPHFCVGAALARLENRIAVAAVLRRFPRLELAEPADSPPWMRSLRSRALTRLPVRF
ncbi:cytochrome P450 [Kitasatospora sp. NPDC048365]|uniref:cytochrome P450 family protein n=1 Tax=Kitasatospora sp. NPDC048365 TaxID=3364050 RepID=UPI00371EB8A9